MEFQWKAQNSFTWLNQVVTMRPARSEMWQLLASLIWNSYEAKPIIISLNQVTEV